jgi:hypothetical protein
MEELNCVARAILDLEIFDDQNRDKPPPRMTDESGSITSSERQ